MKKKERRESFFIRDIGEKGARRKRMKEKKKRELRKELLKIIKDILEVFQNLWLCLLVQ